MSKLTELQALRDVAENRGIMWRTNNPSSAWRDLLDRGWVEWNPWADRYLPTETGRAALKQSNERMD